MCVAVARCDGTAVLCAAVLAVGDDVPKRVHASGSGRVRLCVSTGLVSRNTFFS